ncbi:c-type cytochrome (plasmid) [Ensifer adhaerens]|nr:c-type cytochrome [Ensifer adhaerens]UAY05780.1 c-type cytochrome [Ensifer adhaerens]UAY13158.1 c-type cytochrome [Ensifer adhaerens]
MVVSLAALVSTTELRHHRLKVNTAETLSGGDPSRAPEIFRRYGCAGCHAIPGVPGADGQVGPPLSELSQRLYIAGVLENSSDNLTAWVVSPQRFSPNSAMPPTGVSEKEARDLAAYLYAR